MKNYEITEPNGKIYSITATEYATKEQLIQNANEKYPESAFFLMEKTSSPIIIENNSYIQKIDPGKAFSDALVSTFSSAIVALPILLILSYGLWKKTKKTPNQLGRWWGAWMSSASVMVAIGNNWHQRPEEVIASTIANGVAWFAIGYLIGYILRKIKPIESNKFMSISEKPKDISENKSPAPIDKIHGREKIDDTHWAAAFDELSSGRDNVAWSKAYVEADGNENKAKAIYLRMRVSALHNAQVIGKNTDNTEAKLPTFKLTLGALFFCLLLIIAIITNGQQKIDSKKTHSSQIGNFVGVPDRCKGNPDQAKCVAQEQRLAEETPTEKFLRQQNLEAERKENMRKAN